MEQKTHLIFEIEPEVEGQIPPAPLLTNDDKDDEKSLKVRLDKWLWAARFFKTRALARSAIENGRVFYDGQKTIPSKEIAIGATVLINQGKSKKVIIVRQLSTRRRSTDEANALFEEVSAQMYNNDTLQMSIYTHGNSDHEKKPRKIARFLRRALAMGEPESSRD